MYERLLNILNGVGRPRVLLVGDFMLDNYVYGDTDRISPEAPVVVLNVIEQQQRPGGAGSVAADLATLGAEVVCVGVVGADANGQQLRRMLDELGGVSTAGLVAAADRPTTTKQRIIGLAQHRHQQQLMRIDQESRLPIDATVKAQLRKHVQQFMAQCDVVCLQDYNKGVLCDEFCQEVIQTARRHTKRVIVDTARIADYRRYAGAWMIKPNRWELSQATGRPIDGPESWEQASRQLAQAYHIEHVVVTLDKNGAYLFPNDRNDPSGRGDQGEHIPTRQRTVYDGTGAGDMVLAMLGLLVGGRYAEVDGPTLTEVVCLAMVAGGLEVERFGCVGISREEIGAELVRERRIKTGKLRTLESLLDDLQWHRQQKLKIVFTNGCFDILHPGHINLLTFAKEQGDILIVAINSDRSVRELKGPTRPILKEEDRATLLSALEAVDYIVIFDEDTPLQLIEKISPEVLIKGSDWTGAVVGQEWVEAHGGQVKLMPLTKGRSTTGIIEKVIQQNSHRFDNTGDNT